MKAPMPVRITLLLFCMCLLVSCSKPLTTNEAIQHAIIVTHSRKVAFPLKQPPNSQVYRVMDSKILYSYIIQTNQCIMVFVTCPNPPVGAYKDEILNKFGTDWRVAGDISQSAEGHVAQVQGNMLKIWVDQVTRQKYPSISEVSAPVHPHK